MIQFKKCKGQGKAKGFDSCGELTAVERIKYGLCKSCFAKWLYTSENGKKILNSTIKTVKQPRIDLENYKKEREENKSLSYLLKNTVNACHRWVKKRDKYKDCVSCGQPWNETFQAGHFYKAELYTTMKLDDTNIHGQCQNCNLRREGNESGYRVGLINRYGKGYLDLLDSKAILDKHTDFKWCRIKLKELQKKYKLKLKNE